MRRELILIAIASGTARADSDVRALIAADTYLATEPGYTNPDAADVAWSAHVEWRTPDRGMTLDWVDRESLIGGAPLRELHELSYVDRSLDHLAITVGRFRVPGGFWLMCDGGELAARGDQLELGVYGGSRSFTNGRADTLLSASPHPLPLVGAALTRRGQIQASLAYTLTSDLVSLDLGNDQIATSRQPEQFVDAEAFAPIGEHWLVTAGATAGSRYLVTYPTAAAQIGETPQLANMWFGSQAAYAIVDWHAGDWRLDGTFAALRTKLGQLTDAQIDTPADAAALAAITGSFVEGTTRATWRHGRMLRIDARYRARVWADHRYEQRAQLAIDARFGVLDVELSAGVNEDRNRGVPGYVDSTTLLYRASVGRKGASTEIAVGAAAVAAIGDEASAGIGDEADDARAPYSLEAASYGFIQAWARHGGWFGGIDGELDMHGGGARLLVQLGWAL